MFLSDWAKLAFDLNGTLDNGNNNLSFREVYDGIRDKNIFELLEQRFPETFSFGSLMADSGKIEKVYEILGDISDGIEGRERKKIFVENSGMNLLLAFVIEAMQQGYWNK